MSKPSPVGTVMINAARLAGRSLARDFGEVENLQISKKGPADFVSNADHRAEDIIYDSLSKARPGYGFVMEERGVVERTSRPQVARLTRAARRAKTKTRFAGN